VVAFLTDDWFARVATCPNEWLAAVPDIVVQVDVAGSPTGARPWHVAVVSGAVGSCGAGPADAAELSLTLPWADAVAVARGELDVNAAYMQGRLKTDGPTGPLLALLAGLRSPDGIAAREQLAADTEF
jgi:hypothetical protein